MTVQLTDQEVDALPVFIFAASSNRLAFRHDWGHRCGYLARIKGAAEDSNQ